MTTAASAMIAIVTGMPIPRFVAVSSIELMMAKA
jgi:hypothetical protein